MLKGPSHLEPPPSGGLRKKAYGGQYSIKGVNIGGMCQSRLYVPNFLPPGGDAMTTTEYWHVDVFRP